MEAMPAALGDDRALAPIAPSQRPVDPGHGLELALLLGQHAELRIPQSSLRVQPGLNPGGARQEAIALPEE